MRGCWATLLFAAAMMALSAPGTMRVAAQADEKKTEPTIDKLDDEILRRHKLSTESDTLLAFFKKRVLPENERPAIEQLVRTLGSTDFRRREKATLDLIGRGVLSLDVLRSVGGVTIDGEVQRRIERALQTIHEKDVPREVPTVAVRVLTARPAAGLTETLLAYVPFADNEATIDEIRYALLKHGVKAGKPDPSLLAALSDRAPVRRALAAEALARSAYADHKDALRKLLTDPDPTVRYRLSRAMLFAKERDAATTLIDTLSDLPINAAWQAEDFLLKLATSAPPPVEPMGNDKETREKCKAAWQEWWKKNGDKVDLAKLEDAPRMLGRTLVVLLDQNAVIDLGPDNQPRFEVKNLTFPLDAQSLDEDRVLVAEYHANRVTERNSRGETLRTITINGGVSGGPQAAQRLPNGNTFVATANQFLEYDKDDNVVVNIRLGNNGEQKVMKSMKLQSGEIVCMHTDARVVRYDSKGTELHSFSISINMRLFGGRIHMLPNGRVLVPHHGEGKVVEYDSRGKIVWQIPFDQPIVATRLVNGNTVITSMNPGVGAVEVDRTGAVVWSYQHASNSRVTRAIRR